MNAIYAMSSFLKILNVKDALLFVVLPASIVSILVTITNV